MFPAQLSGINSDEFSRCEERRQITVPGKSLSPIQKTDAAIRQSIYHALWKDDVLRAMEYSEIDVHVKNGVVYLDGHIVSTISQSRIENALRAIPGLLGIINHLVLDDRLLHEVARALGDLEHTYACKFFTGASHGVVSLNGIVSDESVKLLAEKSVASNPNVRAVINHVRVSGTKLKVQDQRFMQPTIGETIYFLDGASGVVRQVIINPNNRCVIAMTIQGKFNDRQVELNLQTDGEARSAEQLVVVAMNEVRHLTRDSGFLYINTTERHRYLEFNPARFFTPGNGWKAPHPYCTDDVLFPVEKREVEYQILEQLPPSPFVVMWDEQPLRDELLVNDSLGG
jgi:osmotically-inducible protein OsmY